MPATKFDFFYGGPPVQPPSMDALIQATGQQYEAQGNMLKPLLGVLAQEREAKLRAESERRGFEHERQMQQTRERGEDRRQAWGDAAAMERVRAQEEGALKRTIENTRSEEARAAAKARQDAYDAAMKEQEAADEAEAMRRYDTAAADQKGWVIGRKKVRARDILFPGLDDYQIESMLISSHPQMVKKSPDGKEDRTALDGAKKWLDHPTEYQWADPMMVSELTNSMLDELDPDAVVRAHDKFLDRFKGKHSEIEALESVRENARGMFSSQFGVNIPPTQLQGQVADPFAAPPAEQRAAAGPRRISPENFAGFLSHEAMPSSFGGVDPKFRKQAELAFTATDDFQKALAETEQPVAVFGDAGEFIGMDTALKPDDPGYGMAKALAEAVNAAMAEHPELAKTIAGTASLSGLATRSQAAKAGEQMGAKVEPPEKKKGVKSPIDAGLDYFKRAQKKD